MSDIYSSLYNPDVLSTLANLSSDEVFTPPDIVNQMLDMLPQELFRDKDTKFLDPATKSGVFLREIAKRLLEGLKDQIPDLHERIDHIFTNQIYGIATTELTSLLARRSTYCSKYPNGKYSIYKSNDPEGNIRFRRIDHRWVNKKCFICGANKEDYEREDVFENYAYEFIHREIKELKNMKFDVIISNPPYQISDGGGSGTSAVPIYHQFVLNAIKLKPRYLTMITPSRWFSGGKGLDSFRDEMLHDNRLTVIHDFIEASDCFPGVQIKGGVSYFLWDRDNPGKCMVYTHRGNKVNAGMSRDLLEKDNDIFIRYNEAIPIFHKISSLGENSFENLVSVRRPFGFESNFRGKSTRQNKDDVIIYQNGGTAYVNRKDIKTNVDSINQWKVYIPFLGSGSDTFPHHILGKPFVGAPGTICTETYLMIGPFKSEDMCNSVISYISTKLFRLLVLLKKPSQNATKKVYSFVPVQDFKLSYSDELLYEKYNISQDEIDFIDTLIRPFYVGDNE